jgi:hypothetical protein
MKIASLYSALAIVLTGGLAHATTTCDDFNLTGKYQYSTSYNESPSNTHYFKITQKGCDITLVDVANSATWKFDMSGQTETRVPESIQKANLIGGELAIESLNSMRFNLSANPAHVFKNEGYREINIVGTSHLPAAGENKFDVTGQMKMTLWFSSSVGRTTQDGKLLSPSDAVAKQVHNIRFKSSEFRVLKVHDGRMPGIIGKAFVSGANYILGALDKLGYTILQHNFELDRI